MLDFFALLYIKKENHSLKQAYFSMFLDFSSEIRIFQPKQSPAHNFYFLSYTYNLPCDLSLLLFHNSITYSFLCGFSLLPFYNSLTYNFLYEFSPLLFILNGFLLLLFHNSIASILSPLLYPMTYSSLCGFSPLLTHNLSILLNICYTKYVLQHAA